MVRFKNRYLLCEYWNDDKDLSQFELLKLIKEAVQINYGDYGLGKIQLSISVKYLSNKLFILRVARDWKNQVWNSLSVTNNHNNLEFQIRILACTGTIRHCELRARRLLSRQVHKLLLSELQNQQ